MHLFLMAVKSTVEQCFHQYVDDLEVSSICLHREPRVGTTCEDAKEKTTNVCPLRTPCLARNDNKIE